MGKYTGNNQQATRIKWIVLVLLVIVLIPGLAPLMKKVNGEGTRVLGTTPMNVRGSRLTNEDAIEIQWDTPNKTEPYTYKVFSKKPEATDFQSISSTNLNKQVKVLNIYPEVGQNITYTTWDGTTRTISKSASAEMWMEEPNQYNAKGFGMGLIDVDPMDIAKFNKDPLGWLTDEKGKYKYDVVFFGSWDSNNSQDLTEESTKEIKKFITFGRGVLFGHDTLSGSNYYKNFNTMRDNVNLTLRYVDGYVFNNIGSKQVKLTKKGLLTDYPWELGQVGETLDIPYAHTSGQIALGDVWMEFNKFTEPEYNYNKDWMGPLVSDDKGQGTNNYYLTTWNNTAMIQTGHSNGSATQDEQKILANTLFYLSQLTTDTKLKDISAMDVYAPKFKTNTVNVTRDTANITIDFPVAEEVDEFYEYYVEAVGQNTGTKLTSETIKVKNTSGLAGYSYIIDNNPTTVPTNKVNSTSTRVTTPKETGQSKYLHVVAVDNKRNKSEPIHKKLDDTPPKVVGEFNNSTEWTKNTITIGINIRDDESGIYKVIKPDGKESYTGDTTFAVDKNGKYTYKIYDKALNETVYTVNVTKIDKTNPNLEVNANPTTWTNKNVEITANGTDNESGIKNVRMDENASINSKNILAKSDIKTWHGEKILHEVNKLQLDANSSTLYGGFYIPYNIIEPKEKYVLSFDMTKLSGGIDIIGGHSRVSEHTEVYIDGKKMERQPSLGYNDFDDGVLYPNDTKKHHVVIYYDTNYYNKDVDKNLYIQPNRLRYKTGYSVVFENIQFEKGIEETPYEPNYKDVLDEKDSVKVNVSQNGTYAFTATDKVGNETKKSINITNIDKTAPEITLSLDNKDWVNNQVGISVKLKDEDSGIQSLTLPDGKIHPYGGGKQGEYRYDATSNGVQTFIVEDQAGNKTTATIEVTNIDKELPELDIQTTPKGWTNKNVEITATGKDNKSGIAGIKMESSNNSKNLVSMKTLHTYKIDLTKYERNGMIMKYSSEGNDSLTGLRIDSKLIEANTDYVLSFDITKLDGNIHVIGGHNFGGWDLTKVYIDGKFQGKQSINNWRDTVPYPNDKNKHHVKVVVKTKDKVDGGDNAIYIQPNRYVWDAYTVQIENVQLELGEEGTPYEPNYDDIEMKDDIYKVNVTKNGEYNFIAMDKAGNEFKKSITITNIDKTPPTVTVKGNPTDYVDEDNITLELDVQDNLSGIKSVKMPDGSEVKTEPYKYKVNANKDYQFVITDNAGNTITHIEKVTKLKIPYTFYIYDAKGKPLEGAEFDLKRYGVKIAEARSNSMGLVDFGKVPADGKYTINQTKAPDGYVVSPGDKDVEVGDTTEPEEFISYPRGTILPATGTHITSVYIIGITVLVLSVIGVKTTIHKKRV